MQKDTTMWKSKLRKVYDNYFEQFKAYSETYNLAKRLGYSSPEKAWKANPKIQGSTNPADYGRAA